MESSCSSPPQFLSARKCSILSGGGSVPAPKASAETWVNMVYEFQKGALSTRLGIPMLYGIDAIHGHNNVYGATIFPHNVGLGVTRDPELVKKIGAATALEVRATGIPYTFAPCIAVCVTQDGRCYESYSEDHKIVQAMTEIIPGLQCDMPTNSRKGIPFVADQTKVVACAKHFVGDGGTVKGIDENNTVIDFNHLLSIHMPAYLDSIRKGVATVMVSYSSWNGKKMHGNRDLVTGFLKDKLKFRGFVISDWQGIDKITSPPHSNYSYSVQAGVQAGIDMVESPQDILNAERLVFPGVGAFAAAMDFINQNGFQSSWEADSGHGLMVAYHCNRNVSKGIMLQMDEGLEQTLIRSHCCKRRLLYFFPAERSNSTQKSDSMSSWCGWHTDHGTLTG